MALVRQIVKRSGGRLGVVSKVGRGSTFWVELRAFAIPLFPRVFARKLTSLLACRRFPLVP